MSWGRVQPGDAIGEFVVESELGHGGMGVVFVARQERLGRRVALKLIDQSLADDPEFRARFEQEARALGSLDSRHVVTVHTVGESDGMLYLATQLLPDGDLGRMIERSGPLPPSVALDVVAQVAEGLADVHRIGLVHRDVKPANVLLARRPEGWHALLGDFGVARADTSDLTATGAAVGTPSYMAPELHRGERATVQSDIYALGCLLWATLTGRPPYGGTTAYAVIRGHLEGPVPQLGTPQSAAVDEVLRGCLAKLPDDRIRTASEVAAQLRSSDLGTARTVLRAPPPPPPPGPPSPDAGSRRGARVKVGVATVAAVVLIGVLASLLVWAPWSGEDAPSDESTQQSSPPSSSEASDASALPEIGADRAAAQDRAAEFVEVSNTYGPDDLNGAGELAGYEASVLALVTPRFGAEFEQNVGLAEQTVADARYGRTTEVLGAGTTFLGEEDATVAVAMTFEGSYPDPDAPGERITDVGQAARLVVGLERVDGEWLVSDTAPVVDGPPERSGLEPVGDERIEPEVLEARSAAAVAAPVLLAYDYRSLDDDLAAARNLTTDDYYDEFQSLFEQTVRPNAPAQRVVIVGTALAAGVANAEAGASTVQVLVLLDREISNTDRRTVSRDQATLTMSLVDEEWLVSAIATDGTG